MTDNAALIVPRFKVHTSINESASRAAGRPIYDEMEVCEIHLAANKQTVGVYPAHEVWKTVETPDGMREPQTYAMRFPDIYKKFKDGAAQSMSGTPVEELTFLTASKRLELKALNVYTAEALASLDGAALKRLGMGGRELKNQAQAYLDNAAGSADFTKLAAENESLREQMRELQQSFAQMQGKAVPVPVEPDEPEVAPSQFANWSDSDIKEWIKLKTGKAPQGNPSHETLVRSADELDREDIAA